MIVLSGADLLLPSGVLPAGTLVLEGDRIIDINSSTPPGSLRGHVIVPGFIDVHVHGTEGIDTLDGGDAIAQIARRLPKYGVTAFCPTTVACAPAALRDVLENVRAQRTARELAARVLPAHLESNFINHEFRGAQPADCLRPPTDGGDILQEIDSAGDSVGIVTLAPELEGALDLIKRLASRGTRVSLGHSGATFAQAHAGISAGACHATHLFNRMPPVNHREPGLAGAVLASEQVAAEIICDGVHVHPAMVRMAVAAKGVERVMAISDGVAAVGLAEGATALLGGRRIRVTNSAAYLEDGTLAGSVATMDRVFRFLVRDVGLSLLDAARLCATTPATQMGLRDAGSIHKGALADLVVMDREFNVKQTYVAGRLVYSLRPAKPDNTYPVLVVGHCVICA